MKRLNRLILAGWPYIVALGIGGLIYFLSGHILDNDLKGFMLGIAGSFVAIPTLYYTYGLAQRFSKRRLTKELFDYAKFQIDREVFKAVRYLMKLTWPYEKHDLSLSGIQKFLEMSWNECAEIQRSNDKYGFQIFRHWGISKKAIESTLENPLLIKTLNEDQTIAIIELLKSVHALELVSRNVSRYFELTGETASGFTIQSGLEMNEQNIDFPDRYLLLRSLEKQKYEVTDFADFPKYAIPNLLKCYTPRKSAVEELVDIIFSFNLSAKNWIGMTGDELILDTNNFRLRMDYQYGP